MKTFEINVCFYFSNNPFVMWYHQWAVEWVIWHCMPEDQCCPIFKLLMHAKPCTQNEHICPCPRDLHQCISWPAEGLSAGNCQNSYSHTRAPQLTLDGRQVNVQTEDTYAHAYTRLWMTATITEEGHVFFDQLMNSGQSYCCCSRKPFGYYTT